MHIAAMERETTKVAISTNKMKRLRDWKETKQLHSLTMELGPPINGDVEG